MYVRLNLILLLSIYEYGFIFVVLNPIVDKRSEENLSQEVLNIVARYLVFCAHETYAKTVQNAFKGIVSRDF